MRKVSYCIGLALAIVAVALLISGTPSALAAGQEAQKAPTDAEVTGKYEGTSTTPDGPVKTWADLKLEDGKLTATLEATGYMITVHDARIQGSEITFMVSIEGMPAAMQGTWKDGKIDGTWAMDEAGGVFTLTKVTK
jgi:glucose/arabinose dehydrogenase